MSEMLKQVVALAVWAGAAGALVQLFGSEMLGPALASFAAGVAYFALSHRRPRRDEN
jgi:hypothetical protein